VACKSPDASDVTVANGASLRDMLAQIRPSEWELFEALVTPSRRHWIRQIRAALASTKRREVDDDALLLRIEMCRRQRHDRSRAGAIREVVESLPAQGPNRSGDMRVWLGDRWVAPASAERNLRRKFNKHAEQIARRANGAEAGETIAQQYVGPVLSQYTAGVRLPHLLGRMPLNEGAQDSVNKTIRPLDELSLPDATDALLREAKRRIRGVRFP
jgi:hypothetical protein